VRLELDETTTARQTKATTTKEPQMNNSKNPRKVQIEIKIEIFGASEVGNGTKQRQRNRQTTQRQRVTSFAPNLWQTCRDTENRPQRMTQATSTADKAS
jgi:hypothetical protein